MSATDSLPDDVETLQRLLRIRDAELGRVRAQALSAEALIAHLRLAIEKMRRELYGQRAERKARLLDQMELELEELEAAAAEDEFAAGKAAATSDNTTAVRGFTRRKPSRKPFPAHLPRERVIVQGPTACACCSSTRLALEGCRGNGRSSNTFGKSLPAGLARGFRKRRPPFMCCRAALPGQASWP